LDWAAQYQDLQHILADAKELMLSCGHDAFDLIWNGSYFRRALRNWEGTLFFQQSGLWQW